MATQGHWQRQDDPCILRQRLLAVHPRLLFCFVFFLLGSQLEISQLPLWLGVAIFSQWLLSRNCEDQSWPAVWTAAQDKNTSVSSFAYQHWRKWGKCIRSDREKNVGLFSVQSISFYVLSLTIHSFAQQILSVPLLHARLWRYRDSEPGATWGPPLLTSSCHYQDGKSCGITPFLLLVHCLTGHQRLWVSKCCLDKEL